jgi:hypothetical protein
VRSPWVELQGRLPALLLCSLAAGNVMAESQRGNPWAARGAGLPGGQQEPGPTACQPTGEEPGHQVAKQSTQGGVVASIFSLCNLGGALLGISPHLIRRDSHAILCQSLNPPHMVTTAAIVAQIPVVPLPPAPVRPIGQQDVSHPLVAGAPWLAAGLLTAVAILALFKLRALQSAERSPSGWAPWSNGPQVQPVRDPKYWSLIVQAERDAQQPQPDSGAEPRRQQTELRHDSAATD